MRKKLLLLLLTTVLGFNTVLSIASAAGNGNTTGMGNYGTNNADGNYKTNADTNDNDFDWGWIGLAGLFGLAGLRGRNRAEHK
jgi:hypothetical protein